MFTTPLIFTQPRAEHITASQDYQLYNRLGATLAKWVPLLVAMCRAGSVANADKHISPPFSGGKADEAYELYWRALELRPGFVRAR